MRKPVVEASTLMSPAISTITKILVLSVILFSNAAPGAQAERSLPRIAHAGGQIGNNTYTNSIDALDTNHSLGFRFFEMDLSLTTDQNVVCLHDWDESFTRSFGLPGKQAVSLGDFEQLVSTRSEFNKCTLKSLMKWLSEHSDSVVVTDAKERNLDALKIISEKYPELIDQVIPQIYHPGEYAATRKMGFERIIWTLYLYPEGSSAVLEHAAAMDLWAIAMDTDRADQQLALELEAMGVQSYVHTINKYADYLYFKSLGIEEVYTDSLAPQRQQKLKADTSVQISDSTFYQAKKARLRHLERRRNRFPDKPYLLYSLSEDFSAASVGHKQVENLRLSEGFLEFDATGNDPSLVFPALVAPRNEMEIFLQLEAPDSSRLEIFYATQAQPNYSESRKVSESLLRGGNEFVMAIYDASPITRIRLDPGTVPGAYRILRLEIRSN
jgi:glycerophosphoryl diester phosphodiesterase